MTTPAPIISVRGLQKSFRIGFFMREVVAVRDATFDVQRGEIFGIVGPNGAGKTTTIKMLMGLIRPGSGEASINGISIRNKEARRAVSYLPETPHFYDYLKPEELLSYFGDLYGLDRTAKRKRIPELLERVGLAKAVDKPLRKFSKGMLQRIGFAQALLPESEIVVLDEPQSGLDPIGRKDVRDLILEERDRGRTILMCSHILPDVEQICDRVVIMHMGRVVKSGPLNELVDIEDAQVEITLRLADADALPEEGVLSTERAVDGSLRVLVSHASDVDHVLRAAMQAGGSVVAVTPHRKSLEDVFTEQALRTDSPEDDR